MFAQATASTDAALHVFDSWWLYVAPLLPFVQAALVKANAGKWFKTIVSVAFAAALAGVSLIQQDWSSATFEIIVLRLGTAWTVAQLIYKLVSDKVGGPSQSLNDIVLPGFGVKVGKAREMVTQAVSNVDDVLQG